MHNHNHECKHDNIKLCKKCNVPYCADCGKEWFEKCELNHYNYWYYNSRIYTTPDVTPTITWCSGTNSLNNVSSVCDHA